MLLEVLGVIPRNSSLVQGVHLGTEGIQLLGGGIQLCLCSCNPVLVVLPHLGGGCCLLRGEGCLAGLLGFPVRLVVLLELF